MLSFDPSAIVHSAYIHWPFCPYKCHFCPFVALASHDQFMQVYHEALKKEILNFASQLSEKPRLNTIFFGGGTPSTYPDDLLLDMSGTLKSVFSYAEDIEISIEVNPGTVRREQLPLWKELGINRLSIGVQSLKDSTLKKLNRHQTAQQVFSLLENAQQYFDNLSVDLILGLPEVSHDEWKALLHQVVTWPIKHVSVYFLTIHENTPLYFKVERNMVQLPADDTMVDLYHWTCAHLQQHGFAQYELSNFARPGYESRHNQTYWKREPYYAFGLGACSFDGKHRFQNEKNLMKYMRGIEQGTSIITFEETLTQEQVRLERAMLGLRARDGLAIQELLDGLDEGSQAEVLRNIDELCAHNFLIKVGESLRLTPAGLVVENQIIAKLSL